MRGELTAEGANPTRTSPPPRQRVVVVEVEIEEILRRLVDSQQRLRLGGPHAATQLVPLIGFDRSSLTLRGEEPGLATQDEAVVDFELDGRSFSFNAGLVEFRDRVLTLSRPSVVRQWERRERARSTGTPRQPQVSMVLPNQQVVGASPVDRSAWGMGVLVSSDAPVRAGDVVQVAAGAGASNLASVRSVAPAPDSPGWRRLGLQLGAIPAAEQIPVEEPDSILPAALIDAPVGAPNTDSRFVTFANHRGELLSAVVDTWGGHLDGPVVIVPSAWGNTKETLVALSEAILSAFRAAGRPVTVVRFDGVHRRGGGHRQPDAAERGSENLHYTFSQGVRDIGSVLDFVQADPELKPTCSVVVSFSISSVEVRRAIVEDSGNRISAWISVVGASDPQSLLQALSGGIDYFSRAEEGEPLGIQAVQGMLLDVDNAGRDAIANNLAFLDDARRDMASVSIPVTWIHGRDDGWNQQERVREMMSSGDCSNRRLIQMPTGHQLRTSREAADVFQFVAVEAARLTNSGALAPCRVDSSTIRRRRRDERARAAKPTVDLRDFWHDYLVGSDGQVGIELVTGMSDYQGFMDAQIAALELANGQRVVDLGAGTGAFATSARAIDPSKRPAVVVEIDFVPEALRRARERLGETAERAEPRLESLVADLSKNERLTAIPVASGSADRILGSLLLNYVSNPRFVIEECFRILRPGGRLVVSSMRRDADVSGICVSGVSELRAGRGRRVLAAQGDEALDRSLRDFISKGGELLGIEADGIFHFWDGAELEAMLSAAGFADVRRQSAYGQPAQATIASGIRL